MLTVVYRVRLIFMGFTGFYKFESYLSKQRGGMFFFPVFLIFCMCCFSGSFLSWVFISRDSYFFSGFELAAGVSVILAGLIIYSLIEMIYGLHVFLGGIGFLRWLRNGGISSWMRNYFYFRGEKN